MAAVVRIGCTGWSLPRDSWPQIPHTGAHLQRGAQRFNAVNQRFVLPAAPAGHVLLARLDRLAARLVLEAATADTVWCIFDNTASGAATENALYTRRAVQGPGT